MLETLCSSQFYEFELKLNLIHCSSTCIISYSFCSIYFFVLTCSLPLVLFFFSLYLLCVFGPYSSTMSRKTRANRVPSTPSVSLFRVQLFKNDCCCEAFEKLNSKRKIWAERSMILNEVDLAIMLT